MDAVSRPDVMWRCPKCNRTFVRTRQTHSCETVSFEEHFEHKDALRSLFDHLLNELNSHVGRCEVVSLPCCIHLCGEYDFLAVLPRKDSLETRFVLRREVKNARVKSSTRISRSLYKHRVDIAAGEDIDEEFRGWLREAYHLRDR